MSEIARVCDEDIPSYIYHFARGEEAVFWEAIAEAEAEKNMKYKRKTPLMQHLRKVPVLAEGGSLHLRINEGVTQTMVDELNSRQFALFATFCAQRLHDPLKKDDREANLRLVQSTPMMNGRSNAEWRVLAMEDIELVGFKKEWKVLTWNHEKYEDRMGRIACSIEGSLQFLASNAWGITNPEFRPRFVFQGTRKGLVLDKFTQEAAEKLRKDPHFEKGVNDSETLMAKKPCFVLVILDGQLKKNAMRVVESCFENMRVKTKLN